MTETAELEKLVGRGYKHGFVTDIESDSLPPGLDEDVVRAISRIKGEPTFLTEWRLKAFRHWQTMAEPHWAHLRAHPIDYQSISYYSAPKTRADQPTVIGGNVKILVVQSYLLKIYVHAHRLLAKIVS
jgi:Fe-S cluster assembly protein SufB